MDFQQTWRQQIQERLARFAASARPEFREVGPNLLYGFLSAMALWPVAEAAQQGEWAALGAFFGVAGGVGANLIANQIKLEGRGRHSGATVPGGPGRPGGAGSTRRSPG